MNVGQVEFSVSSKTLESVLASARELEGILKRIDGATYGGKRGSVAQAGRAVQGAVNETNKAEEELARLQHKRSEQRIKEHLTTNRRVARLNKSLNKEKMAEEKAYNRAVQRSLRNYKAAEKQKNTEAAKYHAESERRIREQMKWRKQDARNKDWADKKEREQLSAQQKALTESSQARAEFQKGVQQQMVNIGAQAQTLGAALQRVTSPFANVYRGLAYGVGYRLLGKVTESISGAFERYDTMKTYDKQLKALGLDASKTFSIGTDKARTAIDNLNESVLGLPTGLDEIVAAMRRYAGATGNVERATKLAIAANNAYIAGNMDDRQKLFTERQLLSLAGGAELSSNQWDSLRRNAPLAMRVVAKDMKMDVQEMVEALKKGTISGQEFLDVFIKAGTEGKIRDAAQVMKQTWDAVSQNMQNALNRAGEGILKTLDDVFTKMDGRSFLQHVLGVDKNGTYIEGQGIRGVIDGIAKSAQEWIKANPDKIIDFFEQLQSIDWKGIVGGFAEMGMYLGKFYMGIAKFMGNGDLIKWMINFNMLGKVIQIAGGFIKGLAWPVSKIITAIAFAGGGQTTSKAVKFFQGLAGAGKAAEAASLSWQGVASKALSIAAIPAMAWSLKETALALQEFSKVDMDWGDVVTKVGQGMAAISMFGTMAGALGALTGASGPFGWVGAIAVGTGTAEVAGIAKAMKWVGEGLNAIADAKMPSAEKIKTVMETMNEIEKYFKGDNPLESLGKMVKSWSKSSEFKAIKSVGDAFNGIANIGNTQMTKGWVTKAKGRLKNISSIITDFEEVFLDLEEERTSYTSRTPVKGKFSKKTTEAKPKTMDMQTRMKQFSDSMKSVSEAFGYIVGIVNNAAEIDKALTKAMSKIPVGTNGEKVRGMFTQAKGALKQITEGLYDFLGEQGQDGKTMMENLQEVSSTFHTLDLTNIAPQLKEIPGIFERLKNISDKLAADTRGFINTKNGDSIANIADKLKPVFDGLDALQKVIPTDLPAFEKLTFINKSIARIKRTIVKLRELRAMSNDIPTLESISGIATAIKEALGELEEIGDKDIEIELKADIKGQDKVISDVKKEIEKLKSKIAALPAYTYKNITVAVTANVIGIEAAVAGAKQGLLAAANQIRNLETPTISKRLRMSVVQHSGGKVGSPLYRSGGGSIFRPRGTDTIPTMLTEGEYVIQRMAAHAIGDTVLQKLNHLDIAGAIQGLSARVGHSISTVNNTKNANLTINNYSSPSVGFVKGNRWVQSI